MSTTVFCLSNKVFGDDDKYIRGNSDHRIIGIIGLLFSYLALLPCEEMRTCVSIVIYIKAECHEIFQFCFCHGNMIDQRNIICQIN